MFQNYLKIAFRKLAKRKGYTVINVVGLGIGMAVCLLIVLFIRDELSFDRHHEKGNRVFRLIVDRNYPGRSTSYSLIPQSYAAAVKLEFPEVEEAVRVYSSGGASIQLVYENNKFEEKRAYFVDSNFFRVFSAKILDGNAETALSKPNAVVITETTAKKYFGTVQNAKGKLLTQEGNNNPPLEVTAVCSDWPANSHFLFDILVSTTGVRGFQELNYVNFAAHTYVLLNNEASAKTIEAKFPAIIEKHAAGNIERNFGMSLKQFQSAGNGYRYYLQPLKDIHLVSHLEGELRPNGSTQAIYIFSAVAVIILLLACINFVNLATARSMERAKEVGIRKTFGSEKKALIAQFLTESTVSSLLSMLVSAGLALLLLPLFNGMSGKELNLWQLFTLKNIILLALFSLATGLLAGLYPAFVLSSFKPITVLRGKFKSGHAGLALRNGLVIFQFVISVILIICTIIVNSQMRYMTGNQLGFNKDHVVIVERTDLLEDRTKAFKNEVMNIPGVTNISGASSLPGFGNYFGVSWQQKGTPEPMTGRGIVTDEAHLATLGLRLKAGPFFSKELSTDSLSLVLNEKAVTELGLKDPIGAQLVTPEDFYNGQDGSQYLYTVVGVVEDFHYQSLHHPITPLVFSNVSRFNDVSFMSAVRIEADKLANAITALEGTWKKFVKDRPFQYNYLDKTLEAQYLAEATTQKIFSFFSSLAIFIACIGLLGLAAYATQQRMREIGIRKVLGASSGSIVLMLCTQFVKLVLLASVIAFPIAWWSMYAWLQEFAYRVNISWHAFAVAGSAAVIVALITISLQALRAAYTSPVKTLKSD